MGRSLAACTILILMIGTSGCGDDISTKPFTCPENAKAEVGALHVLYLQYFLDGDAQHFVARYAPSAVDLGGGPHGDGSIDAEFFTVAYWESFFASPQFVSSFGGKSIDDLVDVSSMLVLTRREAQKQGAIWWSVDFKMSECDMYAIIPAVSGSPLTEDWFAIYRKVGDTWLVVALD